MARLPTVGGDDGTWGTVLNDYLSQEHDSGGAHSAGSAKISTGTDAGKPAASTAGHLYYATDTKILYRDTGATWEEIARGETVTRLAQLSERLHASLTSVGTDDHHAKSHAHDGADGSGTVAHSATTGRTANDHHNQSHADSDHTNPPVLKSIVDAAGDLIVGSDADAVTRLAKGTDGQILTMVSGSVAWANDAVPVTFCKAGTLTSGNGQLKWRNKTGHTLTFLGLYLEAGTAPTGQAIIVDCNKNGTTIFTTQSNRPQIAASATSGNTTTFDVTSMADNDLLVMDVDQIGSGTAGSDLTATLWMKPTS